MSVRQAPTMLPAVHPWTVHGETEHDTMTSRDELAEYVENGYRFLVEHGPALGLNIDAVDLGRLDMSSTQRCILAQANTNDDEYPYSDALDRAEEIWGADWERIQGNRRKWQTLHGFEFPTDVVADRDAVYDTLRELWVERLTQARQGLAKCGCPEHIVHDEGHQEGCANA